MALISCPECGNQVSDRAHQCPNCGYPIEKIGVMQKVKETEVVQIDDEKVDVEQPKKGKLKKVLIALFILIILIVAVVVIYTSCILSKDLDVTNVKMSKWKVVEAGSYGDDYEATVTTEQEKPFIAIVGSYEHEDMQPRFVYMEEGKGVFSTYESSGDDPSVIYNIIGYMEGQKVKDSDINSLTCTDRQYEDYEFSDSSSCYVDIEVELKSKKSGLLFLELSNDMTNEIKHNFYITVVDGVGQIEYYLSDLPIKSRGVEVTATPKYFCVMDELSDTDYSVEKAFDIEKESSDYSTSYSGLEELAFDGYKDGFVVYTEELTDGGDKEQRNKVNNRISFLHNNECQITTYDWAPVEEKMLTPKYDINVVGYFTWKDIAKEI